MKLLIGVLVLASLCCAQDLVNYEFEEGFLDAHGVLIYYAEIGRGAPLMIVHGGPGASHDYFLPYPAAAGAAQ
jgi:proline iminopeptidase